MRAKRILLVSSWYPSVSNPIRGTFVREQAAALAERGHEVHVVSFGRDRLATPLTWTTNTHQNVTEHELAAPSPLHRLIGFYLPQLFASRVRGLVRRLRPDIIHAHAVRPGGVVAALAAADQGIPLVVTEHSNPPSAFWKTLHGRRQIARAYAAADARIAVSEALARELSSLFPQSGPWEVIYNGIDLRLFRDTVPSSEARDAFIYVGGLEPYKNVETLVRAVAQLETPARLTIVGAGSEAVRLKSVAESLGVAHRIEWLGRRSRNEVAELIPRHVALVVPSLSETFGLVCAEALACGRPVVSTLCGGPEEVVPPGGGLFVPVGDPAAMAKAMDAVASGGFLFEAKAARAYVEDKFSLSGIAARLEERYAQLLGEK